MRFIVSAIQHISNFNTYILLACLYPFIFPRQPPLISFVHQQLMAFVVNTENWWRKPFCSDTTHFVDPGLYCSAAGFGSCISAVGDTYRNSQINVNQIVVSELNGPSSCSLSGTGSRRLSINLCTTSLRVKIFGSTIQKRTCLETLSRRPAKRIESHVDMSDGPLILPVPILFIVSLRGTCRIKVFTEKLRFEHN